MSRQCEVSGKTPMRGMNVSHAHNRTHRRFFPNLHPVRLFSAALGRHLRLKVSIHGLRSLEHKGGIDAFLLKTKAENLPPRLRRLKREIRAKQKAAS